MPETDQGILKIRRITENQAANIGTLRRRQYCDQAMVDVETIRAKYEFHFIAERRARAPLPARARVDHGVWVVVTGGHRN